MGAFFSTLFLEKPSRGLLQLLRYIFVGGVAAVFDTSIFFFFSSTLHTHYLVAQTFGFTIGIITNYILSILWVFERKRNFISETSLFLATGIVGLLLSYFFLWILIDILYMTAFENMAAKMITIALVLVWNFTSRKFFVFKDPPTL